jgi:hypothetical protein
MEIVSNCCGARIMEESDICTKCLEHCGPVDLDDDLKVEILAASPCNCSIPPLTPKNNQCGVSMDLGNRTIRLYENGDAYDAYGNYLGKGKLVNDQLIIN